MPPVSVLSILLYATYTASMLLQARTVSVLSTSEVASFKPYTFYASAAYCQPVNTLAWNRGANCDANPGFQPVASGGDGVFGQFWYVGFDPALNTIIVGHQGTDREKIIPLLTDANIGLVRLNPDLFPGVPVDVKAHAGFRDSHARSATQVLAGVKHAMSRFDTASVTMVGHSLGGALALLDSIYLPFHLPAGTTVRSYLYGLPRVGNSAFASYVDERAELSVARITNKKDPVPILPDRLIGFVQVSGEKHIQERGGAWVACSGQDNMEAGCTISDVPNILFGDFDDHGGPYDGIIMGC